MKYLLCLYLVAILFSCADDKQQQRIDDLEAEIKTLEEDKQKENEAKAQKNKTEQERIEKQQERETMISELNRVTIMVDDYDSDGIGHLSNIRLKLDNPTKYNFDFIEIAVTYIKASGDVYKEEKVFFYNVKPYSTQMEMAPESNRGVNLRASIANIRSPDLPKELQ